MNPVALNGQDLTTEQVIAVAYHNAIVEITPDAWTRVRGSRAFLERIAHSGKVIYAINTGFGSNASVLINDNETAILQTNLLLSHAAGVGKPLPREAVRAMMVIRLNTLLAGYSGIRAETLELLQALINYKIHPIIPSQGSVGASGDLCPLSHMAIALLGEGDVTVEANGITKYITARQALADAALQPIQLAYKEGIALNNGTTFMTALGVIAVYESKKLLNTTLQSVALVLEGIMARRQAFDIRIHLLRQHSGQIDIAQKINDLLADSTFWGMQASTLANALATQHLPTEAKNALIAFCNGEIMKLPTSFYKALPIEDDTPQWLQQETLARLAERKINPQDAYSIRCASQVLGASALAIEHVEAVMCGELNAVTDNPLLFEETEQVLSGGNFHGQPLALPLDYLKIALAEIGNLLERQVNKLTDANHNDCLPPFLVEQAGLNSGFMIPQYVCAGLVSENKVLAHPASVDSIPTSANQEDHVSMGSISARQALEILDNVKQVLAIHSLTACQAIDLRQKQLAHWGVKAQISTQSLSFYQKVREKVSYLQQDRLLYKDIEKIYNGL